MAEGEDAAMLPLDHRLPSRWIWQKGGPCHAAAVVDGGGGEEKKWRGREKGEEVERKREGRRREEEVDCGREFERERGEEEIREGVDRLAQRSARLVRQIGVGF
uniref:Uncharacterized protein n=1 Tax=Oryza barthii TaxID=65489 RepID=A0A0D3EMY8_9ORYZ